MGGRASSASGEIDERASGESDRQAARRKRIIWCRTLEPSTVRGTGGSAVSTGGSGVMPFIIGRTQPAAPRCPPAVHFPTNLSFARLLPPQQSATLSTGNKPVH